MAGGPIEAIHQVRPMLAHHASAVTRVVDSGFGLDSKMLNQMLGSSTRSTIAEVMKFAERIGIAADAGPAALHVGHGDSTLLQQNWPKLLACDCTVTGTDDTLMYDLSMVREIAQERAASEFRTAWTGRHLEPVHVVRIVTPLLSSVPTKTPRIRRGTTDRHGRPE